jgi:non-heme chloroperoxidase
MATLTLADGASVSYEERGEGRPLVLLHGVCMSSDFFREQAPLAASARVVALDFRGHGRSPACDHGHTVAQYARDVRELCERLDLRDVVLAGWSMGSIVIWEYLRQFGTHNLAGQIVISQSPSDLTRDGWPFGVLTMAELAEFCVAIQEDMGAAFEEFSRLMFAAELDESAHAHVLDEILRCRPTTATAILLSQTLPDARPVLDGLELPTLLTWGRDEKLVSVAAGEWIRDAVPGAALELFEHSGHCPMLEEPLRFNDIVAGWLEQL